MCSSLTVKTATTTMILNTWVYDPKYLVVLHRIPDYDANKLATEEASCIPRDYKNELHILKFKDENLNVLKGTTRSIAIVWSTIEISFKDLPSVNKYTKYFCSTAVGTYDYIHLWVDHHKHKSSPQLRQYALQIALANPSGALCEMIFSEHDFALM